jgi:hypothetical protein
MSSNELETMSHVHTVGGEGGVDMSTEDHSGSVAPACISVAPIGSAGDTARVSNREVSKSVKVSAGKRRKVSVAANSTPTVGRRTRFGAVKAPPKKAAEKEPPRYTAVDQIKDVERSARKKRLQETFDDHDSKVRELFHLTKFVSLVDYNADTAKEDESEVFREVSRPQLGC